MLSRWKRLVDVVSGEWFFDEGRNANGGAIIVGRSFWVATWLYLFVVIAAVVADAVMPPEAGVPDRNVCCWWLMRAAVLARKHFEWFGAILAGVYAALYSRFASQWSYLAGLYNQIKQAQATGSLCQANANGSCCKQHLAGWKAGFIEDAEDLHLATKPLFATVIVGWSKDPDVRAMYIDNTRGGEARFTRVVARARDASERPWKA